MLRGLAIVVSALAALAAQAQEATGVQPAKGTSSTAGQANAERPAVLASRTAPTTPPDRTVVGTSNGADAGTRSREGAPAEPAASDCSIVETYFHGGMPIARAYPEPPASPASTRGWTQAPYVAGVTRCGHLYILLVSSRSRAAWVVRQARLEGPSGEVLHVEAIRPNRLPDQQSIAVIVANAPAGVNLPRLKLDLSGEDGRVAQVEVEELP